MDDGNLFQAVLLGLLEGLTEFIPVSSTGHILLAGHFLGFRSTGRTFEVMIQLGAVLAVLSVYFGRLWGVAAALPSDPGARRFTLAILLAFLPAALVGALAHDFIKTVLFETPALICSMLIIGGVALYFIDRLDFRPVHRDAMRYPPRLALKIGLFQCLAMVPGVSRSGATIAGALLLGCDKRSAAEFSFFLAIPTMFGAFAYDLYRNRNILSFDDLALIAVGFAAAFVAALVVVRTLLDFVSRHGFTPFAYWRIAVGTLGLFALWVFG
jgi:undecaprenyl-diphosphatase